MRPGAGSGSERNGDVSATDACSASEAAVRNRSILLLYERDLESVRVGDGERPVAPRRLGRLAVQRPARCFDPAGQLADVLGRRYPQPEPLTLLAIPQIGRASCRERV